MSCHIDVLFSTRDGYLDTFYGPYANKDEAEINLRRYGWTHDKTLDLWNLRKADNTGWEGLVASVKEQPQCNPRNRLPRNRRVAEARLPGWAQGLDD